MAQDNVCKCLLCTASKLQDPSMSSGKWCHLILYLDTKDVLQLVTCLPGITLFIRWLHSMGKGWKPAKSTWGTRKESINQIISAYDKSLSENRELKYVRVAFRIFLNRHIVGQIARKWNLQTWCTLAILRGIIDYRLWCSKHRISLLRLIVKVQSTEGLLAFSTTQCINALLLLLLTWCP